MVIPAPSNPWLCQLRDRFLAHWLRKALVIPLCVTGFFFVYFWLLRHPAFPATVMQFTVVDRLIPFQPAAVVPYLTLWFYVFLAPAFLCGRRELIAYSGEVAALTLIGMGTFWLWPTMIPPLDVDITNHPWVGFLKHVDAAGNACPSLHVAFATFNCIWLARLFRQVAAPAGLRWCNAGWCAVIVYSTLGTKQHVAVDVSAGIALGAAAALYDPRELALALKAAFAPLNRQVLALFVSVMGKVTLFAFGFDHVHPLVAATLFLAPDLWILAGLLLPNVSSLIPTATRFRTSRREVWLTIDDGPDPSTTGPMLDLLERHQAKATFFLIGSRAAAHPALVTEIIRRGHTLGNHTHTHPLGTFWMAGPRRTAREVDACQEILGQAGGTNPGWFRAPAGIKTFFLRRVLAQRGLILIGWSARALERWSTSIEGLLRRLTRKLRPGTILLLHESDRDGAQRVALLSALLDHLAGAGYRCVLPERDDLC